MDMRDARAADSKVARQAWGEVALLLGVGILMGVAIMVVVNPPQEALTLTVVCITGGCLLLSQVAGWVGAWFERRSSRNGEV